MGRRRVHDDSSNSEIKKLYVSMKLSLGQISDIMCMHKQVIKRKLQSMGIEIRNRSDAMKQFYKNRRNLQEKKHDRRR